MKSETAHKDGRAPLPSQQGRPLVIAHRGASSYRPEKTMAAYQLAVEQRADMIEIDLHRSSDGAIPIAHDAELERLGGQGEILDCTLAALRGFDAGEGERIPTLEEVLDRFGPQIPFNLELKQSSRGPYTGLPAEAWAAVRQRGLADRTLFSSFFCDVLSDLRQQADEARCALLLSPRWPGTPVEDALALGAEAINPHVVMATPELIGSAHEAGLAVYVYTVDDEQKMVELLDLEVDGIFTNRPDLMRALLTRRIQA